MHKNYILIRVLNFCFCDEKYYPVFVLMNTLFSNVRYLPRRLKCNAATNFYFSENGLLSEIKLYILLRCRLHILIIFNQSVNPYLYKYKNPYTNLIFLF